MKQATIFILSILFLITGINQCFAQQTQTLVGSEVTHGGFGGPVVKFSDIAGDLGVWVGGRGGWIINIDPDHAIGLGMGGHGLVTEHRVPDSDYGDSGSDYYAMNGYGGFEIEYANRSYQLIHLTVSTLVGAGGLMIRDRNFDDIDDSPNAYFVFEPEANAEVNITNFFRIAAGISYRLTSGIGRAGFTDDDFSGLNGVINFKFGKFR